VIYDYDKLKKRGLTGKLIIACIVATLLVLAFIANNLYLEFIQYREIGNLENVFITNFFYKLLFSAVAFVIIFISISMSNIFIKRNVKKYLDENGLPQRNLPNYPISAVFALLGAVWCRNFFYLKALAFIHGTSFGKTDPIFMKDIGYYVFQRPFLMSIYEFISALWLFIILYTLMYYAVAFFLTYNAFSIRDLKVRSIIRHNLVNIAVYFLIRTFSYKFLKEGILYSKVDVVNVTGASYVDVNVWLKYYTVIPFLLAVIVVAAFWFIWKGQLKKSAYTIAVYPALWLLVSIISIVVQILIVKPNAISAESPYLKYNMEKTREAYGIDKIKNIEFPEMKDLTPEIINKNLATKDNIRVVDYKATLDSDTQLQSNTNFYSFQDGDIVNYTINGKEIPVFITAREVDKNRLPEKSYLNTVYKYTHGYGVVINPINRLTSGGQVEFILSGLRMDSIDKNLKINEPRIYYGELTKDYVIVNAANGLNEIDYDGNTETNYKGKGGIKLSFINRLMFALKYGDMNMIVSGYVSPNSKLLLNREIISRAQKAVPFLTVDKDPYILPTSDGRLKWILDAYTTTDYYPYSQTAGNFGSFNYIRNSVKIVIDAYDGNVKYYIIDKNDPIINTYKKIYPGVLSDEPIPSDIAQHLRYPELLFRIQSDVLKRYHLDPDANPQNVTTFYTNQDLWDVAKLPTGNDANEVREIEPYYNMIKLPGKVGEKEELILMRPFTPSNKNNMISWLAVRNSTDHYGEMILFSFPKNTNIYGTYQVEVKINQVDEVSKDMTLWGQSGSRVFKGNLLVIPIEESVLYVEPIYIQAAGESSIPEVREIVVGYQKGEEFKYGIGTSLDEALSQLFKGVVPAPAATAPPQPAKNAQEAAREKLIMDITEKYNSLKKQLDELGALLDGLKK
jgi:uncharacterized membrane protein (UPF0182 family)